MRSWQRYFEVMQEVVEDVLKTQEALSLKLRKSSQPPLRSLEHSFVGSEFHLLAEDVFWRVLH